MKNNIKNKSSNNKTKDNNLSYNIAVNRPISNIITFIILSIIACAFLLPIIIVFMNSFKGMLYILDKPFALPINEMFVGIKNYTYGLQQIGFFRAFGYSVLITVLSVSTIVILTSMTGWYLTRMKNKLGSILYYIFTFSMLVPFQMVMCSMVYITNRLHLDNPIGITVIYLGFGAGLSVFMFCGFVKSIPLEVEEAALIDGCNVPQMFFRIVLPMLKPTAITVAILNAMWVWNDFLLPYLTLDTGKYKTIPIAIQYLQTGKGSLDWGAMMAMLVCSILPLIIFYITCQKHIIEGITTGAVKG